MKYKTKADFDKKLKFDEIEIELQFNQAYEDDTDIFINVVDSDSEIFTTITTKQAKKLIKHLQKMIDYVEE
jgi:di/tripeptidase